MRNKLKDALERNKRQPPAGEYHASSEELRAIDEAMASGVASQQEVEAAFRTFHSS
ncbi:MAG: hypothetical protein P8Z80_09395 [Pseudolabrys sp.]